MSVCSTKLGAQSNTNAKWEGSLSQTGRTVFFKAEGRESEGCFNQSTSATAPEVNQLWARVDGEVGPEKAGLGLPEAHSVLISAATGAAGSGCTTVECLNSTEEPARFEAATSDGSAAVFASAQQLTDNASQGNENLYESGVRGAVTVDTGTQEPNAAARELFDVSEAQGGGGGVGRSAGAGSGGAVRGRLACLFRRRRRPHGR